MQIGEYERSTRPEKFSQIVVKEMETIGQSYSNSSKMRKKKCKFNLPEKFIDYFKEIFLSYFS